MKINNESWLEDAKHFEESSNHVSEMIKSIVSRRSEILEEFCKAYLTHLAGKGPPEELVTKIELVETQGLSEITWHFRLKEETP